MATARTYTIFSEARFVVFRAICLAASTGVGLREIAYRSQLSVGAVQTALRSLRRLKNVRLKSDGRRVLYFPNEASADSGLFGVLFAQWEKENIASFARIDGKNVSQTVASVAELHQFGNTIKRLNP